MINLEIAGVNDDAERRADGERDTVNRAVRDGNEFYLVWPDFDAAAGNNFAEGCRVEKRSFFKPLLDEREREARAENGNI